MFSVESLGLSEEVDSLTLLDLYTDIETRFSQFYTLAPRLVEGSGAPRAAPQLFPRDLQKTLVTIRCHRNGYYYLIHFDYETNFGGLLFDIEQLLISQICT